MIIKVIVVDKEAKKFQKGIVKIARKLAKLLPPKGLIEVCLVSDKKMWALNKKFMKKDKSTNVLSFANPKGFLDKSLGEVYLNPLFIEWREEDFNLMLVHGVLHILGYDHGKKGDKIKMERKEKQLLLKLSK